MSTNKKVNVTSKERQQTILLASKILNTPTSLTAFRILDYILSNPLCNAKQIDLTKAMNSTIILSSSQRNILWLSNYLQTIINIPDIVARNIAEYSIETFKWNKIYNYLPSKALTDLTLIVLIRVPSHLGNRRIGIILGNYPNAPSIGFEIHNNGKTRIWWNNGEIDMRGVTNLADGKKHIVAFVRDTINNQLSIYIDGELDIVANKCGTDKYFADKCFLFGRDYRNETVSFKGDILRMNMWSKAMNHSDIKQMTYIWNTDEYIVDKQRLYELNISSNVNVIINDFTLITLIKIPLEIGDSNRVGVILGNYPQSHNFNFEIHSKGRTRIWWNNGEIDLKGKMNLVDNKYHCVIFVRDTGNKICNIYVDGKLDISVNKVGTNVTYTGNLKIGRDYRGNYDYGTSFKGDIIRLNAYTTVFDQNEMQKICDHWLS